MKRIILGTDGSASSLAAAEWCATVARATRAEVLVVHATTAIPPWDPGGGGAAGEADQSIRELEGGWTAPLRSLEVPVRTLLAHDNPAAFLLQTAEHNDADLIVMGRREHPQWTPALLGSVAHTVLHDARCPVAIVPQLREEHAHRRRAAVALVGVDGSAPSLAALRFGLKHASTFGLELRALYAVDLHAPKRGPLEVMYDEEDGALVGADAVLAKLIAETAADFPTAIAHETVFGEAGDQLTQASAEAELLIVGNVQRGALGELVHGSTGHYSAAHASCPVVLVPVSTDEEEAEIARPVSP